MDVTLNNFNEALPEVFKAIDECDFIAIDTEFTGLRNGPNVTAYDTPAMYYAKLKDGSLDFLLIQVGLCTFKFDHLQNIHVYKAFNFYVFPRTIGRGGNDVNFLCQSSSINFLCNFGFDFNKLFKEGIPYLNIAEEEVLQEELNVKYENLNQSETSFSKVPIPEELSSTIENACTRIEKFLSPDNEEKEIIFENCTGFTRKLIFQTAYERFSSKNLNLCTKWVDYNALLVATKGKSKAEMEKENFEKSKREISDAVGFSRIIKHISNSKKLIVGHNMLLDICHIVNRFCWPLPDSYWEFKEMVHTLFPRIIDTKYMCSAYPFRDLIPSNVLAHMMKRLHEPPFEFKDAEAESSDFSYSKEKRREHEAGFDAYMTGRAFISLTTYLGEKSKQISIRPTNEILKPFENRIHLMRIIDYSYVNLKGDEPKPTRNHVFHLSFPREWKTDDIMQLFKPYGDVHVSYCNDNTAWVTLLKQEKAEAVISDLIEANLKELPALRKPYTVVTCSQYCEEKMLLASQSNEAPVVSSRRRSLKMNRNSTDICSPAVSQSSGDSGPADVDAISSNKRSSAINDVSRKRKKNQNLSTEATNASDCASSNSSPKSSFAKQVADNVLVEPIESSINILLEQLKGSEGSGQKTFEEPSWE